MNKGILKSPLSFDVQATHLSIKKSKGYRIEYIEPDSFYELTKEEAMELSKPVERTVHLVEKPSEEQRRSRLSQMKKTTIKFRLPDGTEMLRDFLPADSVADIYEFVQEVCTPMKFSLRKPYGKNGWIVKEDKPLYEAGLVPSGVVCVVMTSEPRPKPPYIRQDILDYMKCVQ